MNKIKCLPPEVVKKIAAGEVILRPASCVKELIENSLDAQSSKIVIELKRGGKELIKVSDDGVGMTKEDLLLSIARYATSKITEIEDLKKIKTFGFRGEALAAIASVSHLRIETAVEDGLGDYLLVEGGAIKEVGKITRKRGTTVIVREIFYNLPVRRNFLKSDNYEARIVTEVVKNYTLTNFSVAFQLKNENHQIFSLPKASSLKERLSAVIEKESFEGLVEFNYTNPLISIYGFVTEPSKAKESYEIQAIFFNNRPVRSRMVSKAVYEGYGGTLLGKNPNFVILLSTDPENLDVNVHPTKDEVRFIDEKFLFDFVSEAIRKSLNIKKRETFFLDESFYQGEVISEPEAPARFWQLHNTYIFAQIKSGYCVIDQHTAHERILFEEIIAKEKKDFIQPLLFPILLELKPELFLIYNSIKEDLTALGIESEVFGENTIAIKSIPKSSYLGKEELKELFLELKNSSELKKREALAKIIACAGAIKRNKRLSLPEMENLINRLFACKDPYFCPHGRPTLIKIDLKELADKFGRKE